MGKVAGYVAGGVVVAVIIVIIGVLSQCFRRLDSSEVAIAYNTYTKDLQDEVFFEGRHVGPPTRTFIKFPSIFQTLTFSGKRCLNKDGVTVSLSVSMQYRLRPAKIKAIVEQFQNEDRYESMLTKIGSSAIHDICCLYNTTQMQSERGRLMEDLSDQLVKKFDRMHTDVQDIQLNNINRPARYENAVKSKESSREDIEVAKSEQPQLLISARTTKREAESEADIIINKAKSEQKIMLNKAKSEAEAILNDYRKEAEVYKQLKEANGLDNIGFLAYMGIRAIANAKNPVYVGMKGPAETSFMNT